jgi:thioredoxin-related protein
VLNDSEVETYMQDKFIGVLMDAEKDKGKERFEHYGLSGHPNFAIIDKDNKMIGQHNGKLSKQEFLDWIKPFE